MYRFGRGVCQPLGSLFPESLFLPSQEGKGVKNFLADDGLSQGRANRPALLAVY